METEFRSVEEEEKPKVGEEDKEEKMKLEVGGGNDAVKGSADDGSVGGLDFPGNKLSITTNNTARYALSGIISCLVLEKMERIIDLCCFVVSRKRYNYISQLVP